MSRDEPPRVAWTISGTDSSGGAGMLVDLKTYTSLGVHGSGIVTAVTAQSLDEAFAVFPIPGEQIAAQLAALAKGPRPRAIKIGMLGSVDAVEQIARYLRSQPVFAVLDPVLASTSGRSLADTATRDALMRELVPLVDLVTPNIPEVEGLLGFSVSAYGDMVEAAKALIARGARAVLIKGGHDEDAHSLVRDYYRDADKGFWLTSHRLPRSARGTGCALSSAVAGEVANGEELVDALVKARGYVQRGLRNAVSIDGHAAVLAHGPWPVDNGDMPWVTFEASTAIERPAFPSTGPHPLGFYPIVDRTAWIKRLVPHGVSTIQLRIKDLSGDDLSREIEEASQYCRQHDCRLFVNDHWELALRHKAYGVHLGQEDLPRADLDALRRAKLRLGISTHSYFEAAVAHGHRPSYIALGPIFPTTCKSMRFGPQGMTRLREWRALFDYPLVAIGGLKLEDADAVLATGAKGAAVISDVLAAKAPEARAAAWIERMSGA